MGWEAVIGKALFSKCPLFGVQFNVHCLGFYSILYVYHLGTSWSFPIFKVSTFRGAVYFVGLKQVKMVKMVKME